MVEYKTVFCIVHDLTYSIIREERERDQNKSRKREITPKREGERSKQEKKEREERTKQTDRQANKSGC